MVKKLTILLLFLAIIAVGIFQTSFLSDKTQTFTDYCDIVIESVRMGDERTAQKKFNLLISEWDRQKKIFEALVEHDEIDQIETSLKKASVYLEEEEPIMFLSEAETLLFLFRHIREIDSFSLENIL